MLMIHHVVKIIIIRNVYKGNAKTVLKYLYLIMNMVLIGAKGIVVIK